MPSTESAFWSKVDSSAGAFECWPWLGARFVTGYGAFRPRGRTATGAHRMSLELSLGRELGEGMQACHTCDNRICANPAHLFEGTATDNARDMVAKGRHGAAVHPESIPRGEQSHAARLTEAVVRRVRTRRAEGVSYPQLAAEFGITQSHARRLAVGESWSHIPMEASRV